MTIFLRNCWYVACWDFELEDKPLAVQIIGTPLVLYRGADKAVNVLEDRCPHRHAPLSLGRIEGDNLRCMYHGLLFDKGGRCLSVPGNDSIPTNTDVQTFPVEVRDSWIWVWMGDPKAADPDLIPKAFGLDHQRFVMRADRLDYEANYMLINDNLCDLSHVDFVHEMTLGKASGGGWSEKQPRVMQRPRGLRIERWLVGKPASPGNPTLVDNWATYDYVVPGVFIQEVRAFPHGMAGQMNYCAPTAEPMSHIVDQQAVTPLTNGRTRYFFATGMDNRMPERVLNGFFATVQAAFSEDRTIIEAQQRIWDLTPPETPKAFIAQDKAVALFRRTIERLKRAEDSASEDGDAATSLQSR